MNSFQDSVKEKMPAEIRPGTERQRDPAQDLSRVAPSTSAHSSSS
jgi:hypothetical protein